MKLITKLIFTLTLTLLLVVSAHSYAQDTLAQEKRVAILVSSYADQSRPELSYDLEELAQAYLT
jgi:hypothetical protein